MPYIKQEKRDVLDPAIDEIFSLLMKLHEGDLANNMDGNMNYIITRLLKKGYTKNYASINAAIGLLGCVSHEFYDKVARPYENQKEYENGEVEE